MVLVALLRVYAKLLASQLYKQVRGGPGGAGGRVCGGVVGMQRGSSQRVQREGAWNHTFMMEKGDGGEPAWS